MRITRFGCWMIIVTITMVVVGAEWCWAAKPKPKAKAKVPLPQADKPELEAVRLAIEDLIETFGDRYPRGREYLNRLEALEKADGSNDRAAEVKLAELREEALLANPLLDFEKLIFLKRKRGQLALPTNHQCNTCLDQAGYDNELAVL